MKKILAAVGALVLLFVLANLFQPGRYYALATAYQDTVLLVDSVGNPFDGVASAIAANYNRISRVVNSSGLVLDQLGNTTSIANDTITGTTLNKLVVLNSSGQAIIAPAGTTSGVIGVCVNNCGTSGSATIQLSGIAKCVFSGGITVSHYVMVDASIAGDCSDAGAAFPATGSEGTIVSPTTSCGGGPPCGPYKILIAPDAATNSGGGSINSPTQVGNPGFYASAAKTISPIPNEIHAGTGTLYAAFSRCPTNSACTVIADPGQTYTLNSPLWVGGPNSGAEVLPQTLIVDNSHVICSDTTAGRLDDCIILGDTGRLYCTNSGKASIPAYIEAAGTATLNSVVTTAGGVIEDAWQATHAYLVGQVIFDGANTQIVSVAGTSGGSPPTWQTVDGQLTSDGGVTWKVWSQGRIGSSGSEVTISDCTILGTTNAAGAVNNVVRISGLNGGLGIIRNNTVGSLSDGGGPTGGSYGKGGTGMLIDDGQDNLMCTASHAPVFCCTGVGTGTCQSGAGGGTAGLLKVTGIFLAPGTPPRNGPAFGVAVAGHTSGGAVVNVEFDTGQIADITGSNNVALLDIDGSGAGAVRNVHVHDMYFEVNGSAGQQPVGSDVIYDNNGQEVYFDNVLIQKNGSSAIANCLHIANFASAFQAQFVGKINNSPCTNAINNAASGQIIALGSITEYNYTYNHSGTALQLIDGNQALTGEQLQGFVASANISGTANENLSAANQKFVLTGNATINWQSGTILPTPSATQRYPVRFQVCQNATGNFTLAFTPGTGVTAIQWSGGSQPGYTLTANNGDFYACLFDGTNLDCKLDMSNVPC